MLGIGTDSVEIGRVRAAVERGGQRLLDRLFTAGEQAVCAARRDPYPCYAGRFAAKEAVLKALGTGLSLCRWTDVQINRDDKGRPEVSLAGGAAVTARDARVARVLVSISHDRERALAFAVALEGDDPECG